MFDTSLPLKKCSSYHNYKLKVLVEKGSVDDGSTELCPSGLNAFAVLKLWKASPIYYSKYSFILHVLRDVFQDVVKFKSDIQFPSLFAGFPNSRENISFSIVTGEDCFLGVNDLSHIFLKVLLDLMAICSEKDSGTVCIYDFGEGVDQARVDAMIMHIGNYIMNRGIKVLLT